MTYGIVIFLSWVTFLLVWGVTAFGVKRDIRGRGASTVWRRFFVLRVLVAAFFVFLALRVATGTAHYSFGQTNFLSQGLFTPPEFLGWIAAIFAVLGVAFAIWARLHLGRNWSSAPAVKEDHELVTSGPYRFVRHPIYTGVILATLGAALTGSLFGICGFLVISALFYLRIGKEERIMLELFPDAYPVYQSHTKKLIPFVW